MKTYTKYRKTIKVTYLFTTCAIFFAALFFAPVFSGLKSEGENWFAVSLNGQPVGSCADLDLMDGLVADARRQLASDDGELVYIPAEVTAEGKEVLFGQVDTRQQLAEKPPTERARTGTWVNCVSSTPPTVWKIRVWP